MLWEENFKFINQTLHWLQQFYSLPALTVISCYNYCIHHIFCESNFLRIGTSRLFREWVNSRLRRRAMDREISIIHSFAQVCNVMTVYCTNTPFKPTSPGNFPGESLHILRAGRPGKVLEHLSDRPQFPRGSCHGYESPESLVRCTGSNRAASERGFRLRHAQLRNFGVKQLGVFTWTRIMLRKTFRNVIRPFPDLKAWF